MKTYILMLCALVFLAFLGFGTPASAYWHMVKVDSTGCDILEPTSLVLDGNGQPHIAYYDYAHGYLKYARMDKQGQWHCEIADYINITGDSISLALNGKGQPRIAYQDWQPDISGTLKYAWNNGHGWRTMIVDSGDDMVGYFNSLDVDKNNLPHIAYSSRQNDPEDPALIMNYARMDADGKWHKTSVCTTNGYGELWNSIALDENSRPRIAFGDGGIGALQYAVKNNGKWVTTTAYQGPVGYTVEHVDLALDTSGMPHISFGCPPAETGLAGQLLFAEKGKNGWKTATVDNGVNAGWDPSLALDSEGKPRIAYGDETIGALQFAARDSHGWWHTSTIFNNGYGAMGMSLALDSKDRPRVSYYDSLTGDLYYAWWDNTMPP